MKLSVAAGILAQVLPVTADKKLSEWLRWQNRRHLQIKKESRVVDTVVLTDKGEGTFRENPKWTNKVNSRFSRNSNSNRQLIGRSNSGTLVNQHGTAASNTFKELVVCDPTSMDPDVGVLSCGSGNMCTSSNKSILGGICTPKRSERTSNQRHLHSNPGARDSKAQKWGSDNLKPPSARRLKNGVVKSRGFCDPWSSDPDIGVLSCKNGQQCMPSKTSPLGGECLDAPPNSRDKTGDKATRLDWWNKEGPLKKFRSSQAKKTQDASPLKECDPTEADLGILTCGVDKSCVRNDDSAMGGFCADTTSRRLYSYYYDPGSVCDSSSTYWWGYSSNCDCTKFDNATKTGSITCTYDEKCMGNRYYGCYATCGSRSFTDIIENNTRTTTWSCMNISSPRSESFCVSYQYNSTDCQATFNNEMCKSCTTYSTFDCSNIPGGPVVTSYSRPFLPVIKECYKPVDGDYCNLCGYSMFIPYKNNDVSISLTGFGDNFTCRGLNEASMYNQISTAKCPEASALAQSSCCVYSCYLCPWPDVFPTTKNDTLVTVEGVATTCGALNSRVKNYSISKEECPAVVAAAADSCCEARCYMCNYSYMPYPRYSTPVTVPGFDQIKTCGDLNTAIYMNYTITGDSCAAVPVEVTQTACCGSPYCTLCGPYKSMKYDFFDVNLTNVPGFGDTTCGDINFAAYRNRSLSSDECAAVGSYVQDKCCWQYRCPVCGPNGTIPRTLANITTTFPGLGELTCGDIREEAYYGRLQNLSCDTLAEVAQDPCCRERYMPCRVCGPSGYMPYENITVAVTLPYDGLRTCYDVQAAAYFDYSLNEEMCSTVSAAVKEQCCHVNIYDPCYLCGTGNRVTNPLANITSYGSVMGTCLQLGSYGEQGLFNEYMCEYMQSMANDTCCHGGIISQKASELSVPSEGDEAAAAATMVGKSATLLNAISFAAVTATTFFWRNH